MELSTLLQNPNFPVSADVTQIRYDSRLVQEGDLYVALKGVHTDGHLYVKQALEKGAAACVVSETWLKQHPQEDPRFVSAPNTAAYMAELSARLYDHPSATLKTVGVTGTNGKTTVSHLVQALLNPETPCGLIGTLGLFFQGQAQKTLYTSPFSPEMQASLKWMKDSGAQAVAVECSSHALEQHRLSATEFDVGIFTNLSQDHLDYHHTMEAYATAKAILFESLVSKDGVALINLEDATHHRFLEASKHLKTYTYGLSDKADIYAQNIRYQLAGSEFDLCFLDHPPQPIQIQLPGQYNILNTLAALAACDALGEPLDKLIEKIKDIKGVPGRLEVVSPANHPFTVVVDYAHTPDSLENVLKTARHFTQGRVLTVFGCGGDRDVSKRPLMAQAAEQWSDLLWVTSDNPRSEDPEAILNDIKKGLNNLDRAQFQVQRQEAIAAAIESAQANDLVLIAGKGHETTQQFKDHSVHFDDREEAQKAIGRLMA